MPFFQKILFAVSGNTGHMAIGLLMTVLRMPHFNIGMGHAETVEPCKQSRARTSFS